MPRLALATCVAIVLACTAGVEAARADIYTWVDAKGAVNLSNLEPPQGSRITNVTRETPQALAARNDAAHEAAAQAEVQALADRVRQLEAEVELARRPPPAPAPIVAYVPVSTPVYVPYTVEASPPPERSCDGSWYGCGAWSTGFFPPSVVVVTGFPSRRSEFGHRTRGLPVQRPVVHRPQPFAFPPSR